MEIRLKRFKTARGVILASWPWFATLVFLAALNFGAAPLLEKNPGWIPGFGVLNLICVLVGLLLHARLHARAPREFFLRVSSDRVELVDDQGRALWSAQRRRLVLKRENYVMSSRWGSFSYPVLGLIPSGSGGVALAAPNSTEFLDATKPLYLLNPQGHKGRAARRSVVPYYEVLDAGEFERVARELSHP